MDALKSLSDALGAGDSPGAEAYRNALNEIFTREVSEALLKKFLQQQNRTLLRAEALIGGIEALQSSRGLLPPEVATLSPSLVDTCGTGGDGQQTFNISTAAALVAAGAGVKVAKHGNRSFSSSSGSADCLEALGIKIEQDSKAALKLLNTVGFAFLYAPLYYPAMKKAAAVRKALGVRTLFNLLGPLANPFQAKRQILGVGEAFLQKPMADTLLHLGSIHAWVVYGEDGVDEISLGAPTRVTEIKDGKSNSFIFDPREHGFQFCTKEALRLKKGANGKDNAVFLEALLQNQSKDQPKIDVVLINAAAAILVSGLTADFKEALQMARDSLNSGEAWKRVEKLRKI